MTQLYNYNDKKERILSMLKMRGPCLPVQIAKNIDVNLIFAGAFLSELYGEKKLKISNMKVGSSPLYYLQGQEGSLENFIQHLNLREREAFSLLKMERVLDDEKQTPIIRVALRAIPDFAIPVKFKENDKSRLFWRYYMLNELDAQALITEVINGKALKNEEIIVNVPIEEKEIKEEIIENKAIIKELPEEVILVKTNEIKKDENETKIQETEKKPEKKSKSKKEDNEFSRKLKNYLARKDIELLEVIADKKKEFIARVKIDILFGKQELFLVAKDKKRVNDNDLILAMQNVQNHKMPVLFISPGDLHGKAKEFLQEWGNLIRFEKIKG